LKQIPYPNIIDATNVPNMHQGALRFAWLNLDLLQQAIFSDLMEAQEQLVVKPNLVVTCMDQLDDQVMVIKQNELIKLPREQLLGLVQDSFSDFKLWSNWGATRESVVERNVGWVERSEAQHG
jgi:hypothetical protein